MLIHRPRYPDWSLPKGKLDRNETEVDAACREVAEETGLQVRLGPRLPEQEYELASGATKTVAYWSARPVTGSSGQHFIPNVEVDKVRWLPLRKARAKLTYDIDKELIDAFATSGYASEPLVVVRHAEARKRSSWRGNDNKRPLKATGKQQAERLVPLLSAYGVGRVVTSDATRCVQTVEPYVTASTASLVQDPVLSEQAYDERRFARRVRKLLADPTPTAVCTHRPQLRPLFEVAGVELIGLMPAEVVVLHRRDGKVVDCEQHAV